MGTGHDGILLFVRATGFDGDTEAAPEAPEFFSFGVGHGIPALLGAFLVSDFLDAGGFFFQVIGVVAIHLDEEESAVAASIVELFAQVGFAKADGFLLHKFYGAGEDALAEDGDDSSKGCLHIGKAHEEGAAVVGLRQELKGCLVDDGECAFTADEEVGEAIAGSVFQGVAAGTDRGAIGEKGFQSQDIVSSGTVFDGPHAAGIVGDITADGRAASTGRVRWIK